MGSGEVSEVIFNEFSTEKRKIRKKKGTRYGKEIKWEIHFTKLTNG